MKIKLLERLKRLDDVNSTLLTSQPFFSKSIESLKESQLQQRKSDFNSSGKDNERATSELWQEKSIRPLRRENEHHTHKKEDIKRSSRFNEFSYVYDHSGKRSSLYHQIIPEKECNPCLTQSSFPK